MRSVSSFFVGGKGVASWRRIVARRLRYSRGLRQPAWTLMGDLLLFAAAGFAATFVDGALGMGFGPTSSSILLGTGLAPAAVSTSVNIAKLVTGIASAI